MKSFQGFPATHDRVFEIVRHALQWMRVLSRQFWIGTGAAGVAAASRGFAIGTSESSTAVETDPPPPGSTSPNPPVK